MIATTRSYAARLPMVGLIALATMVATGYAAVTPFSRSGRTAASTTARAG
jgi:hypothetical protein